MEKIKKNLSKSNFPNLSLGHNKVEAFSKRKINSFDLLGNIAVVKFPKEFSERKKKIFAKNLFNEVKAIKTVIEKVGKIKGRLRKFDFKHLAGEKTSEVLYKENNCVFRFNLGTSYFSSRLSNERKEIALNIEKNNNVLVMFAGVGPYSIVIAKNSPAKKVFSNEINREANKYFKLNMELNNVKDKIEFLPGDIKRIALKMKGRKIKFDVIIMPRPRLKESFLKEAFMLSGKGTKIFYYDFCGIDEISLVIEKIKQEAKNNKRKIKINQWKKAGEIAPYKIRLRVDFVVI